MGCSQFHRRAEATRGCGSNKGVSENIVQKTVRPYLARVLSEILIILAHRDTKNYCGDAIEAPNPLTTLRALTAYINQPKVDVVEVKLRLINACRP